MAPAPAVPAAALSPSTSAAALHQPFGGNGFGGTFNLHQDGRLVAELRDAPRCLKGLKVAEVAAALDDVPDDSHRHELVFRTSGVIPSAAGLGGSLIGGALPSGSYLTASHTTVELNCLFGLVRVRGSHAPAYGLARQSQHGSLGILIVVWGIDGRLMWIETGRGCR
jgi:hypothetical protein